MTRHAGEGSQRGWRHFICSHSRVIRHSRSMIVVDVVALCSVRARLEYSTISIMMISANHNQLSWKTYFGTHLSRKIGDYGC